MYKLNNGMTAGLDWTILAKEMTLSNQFMGGGNPHVLVDGPSGSGKSYSEFLPNIMQINSSMVIVDQKGYLLKETKAGLESAGYNVIVLDFIHPELSTHTWNPLALIKTEEDEKTFAELVVEAKGHSKDRYWDQAAEVLLMALYNAVKESDPGEVPTLEKMFSLFRLVYQGGSLFADDGPQNNELHRFICGLRKCSHVESDTTTALDRYLLMTCEEALKRFRGRYIKVVADPYFKSAKCDDHGKELFSEDSIIVRPEERNLAELKLRYDLMKEVRAELAADVLKAEKSQKQYEYSRAYDLWMQTACNASNTFRCILSEFSSAVEDWNKPNLLKLMSNDNPFDMRSLGRAGKPTALFIVCSDTTRALDPIVSLLESQLFSELIRLADDELDGALEQPVTFYLDDFASGTPLKDAPKLVANVRSRNIRMIMAVQSLQQLRHLYGADADSIIANCDTRVMVGGVTNWQEFAELNRGERPIVSSPKYLDKDSVIVFRRGEKHAICSRYDIHDHPNYQYFQDAKRDYSKRERKAINLNEIAGLFNPGELVELLDREMNARRKHLGGT